MTQIPKSKDRLEVLERIKEYERDGRFDVDVENDPPSTALLPDQVDYLNKKLSSKIKTYFANIMATKYFEKLIKQDKFIIEKVEGLDNVAQVKTGAILTCNHFNVCDNYAVYRPLIKLLGKRRLYKVIREGNYTGFKGAFGFFFRHCNTLPLSSNTATLKLFISAVKKLLARGELILVFPEQSMWWNYKKPRPFQNGAFKLAIQNNVPVIPAFITMRDSGIIGADGFDIQKYTIHYMTPIYPKKELSVTDNVEYMRSKNYQMCKELYEKVYGITLSY